MILPKRHLYTELVIDLRAIHMKKQHSGPVITLSEILETYWNNGSLSTFKHYLKKCASCIRRHANMIQAYATYILLYKMIHNLRQSKMMKYYGTIYSHKYNIHVFCLCTLSPPRRVAVTSRGCKINPWFHSLVLVVPMVTVQLRFQEDYRDREDTIIITQE